MIKQNETVGSLQKRLKQFENFKMKIILKMEDGTVTDQSSMISVTNMSKVKMEKTISIGVLSNSRDTLTADEFLRALHNVVQMNGLSAAKCDVMIYNKPIEVEINQGTREVIISNFIEPPAEPELDDPGNDLDDEMRF